MAKTLIPKTWGPTPRGRVYARTHGINETLLPEQVEKFRDHHRAKGSKFEDHDAAWQTWCRRYQQYNPPLKDSSEPLQSYVYAGRRHPEEIYPLPPDSPFKQKMRSGHSQAPKFDAWRAKALEALPDHLAPHEAADWIQKMMRDASLKMNGSNDGT